jgi:hypothetical protein
VGADPRAACGHLRSPSVLAESHSTADRSPAPSPTRDARRPWISRITARRHRLRNRATPGPRRHPCPDYLAPRARRPIQRPLCRSGGRLGGSRHTAPPRREQPRRRMRRRCGSWCISTASANRRRPVTAGLTLNARPAGAFDSPRRCGPLLQTREGSGAERPAGAELAAGASAQTQRCGSAASLQPRDDRIPGERSSRADPAGDAHGDAALWTSVASLAADFRFCRLARLLGALAFNGQHEPGRRDLTRAPAQKVTSMSSGGRYLRVSEGVRGRRRGDCWRLDLGGAVGRGSVVEGVRAAENGSFGSRRAVIGADRADFGQPMVAVTLIAGDSGP